MTDLTLVRFPSRPDDWDAQVRQYADKTLFHESCWHAHLTDIHPSSRIAYYRFDRAGRTVGLFCMQRVRKALLPIGGSPLPGTGTNYMGPLLADRTDLPGAIRAIAAECRRSLVLHLELASVGFDADPTVAERAGLTVHPGVTHLVPLPPAEAEAWSGLKGTCRNRVKKAQQNGLVAEVTADASIVERFHEQYIEVYAKQGMVVPFGLERGRSLFARLMPAGRLLPIWIRAGERVVAAGLFPFDERAVYFWGAASWLADQHLNPNELLHWTVMREAIARGVPAYNMCGGTSQFKDKFGGADVPYHRYSWSISPLLGHARRAAQAVHKAKLVVGGRLRFGGALPARRRAPREE